MLLLGFTVQQLAGEGSQKTVLNLMPAVNTVTVVFKLQQSWTVSWQSLYQRSFR